MTRAAKAGASIAAAGVICAKLYDANPPRPNTETEELVKLPDYSVAPVNGKTMAIVNGSDRVKTVRKAIELLGGIKRFVNPGDIVAIKPNVAFASPPMLGATSNPQLIAEVVRLCYEAAARKVIVTDNPINDPASCFTLSRITDAAEAAGAKIILPRDSMFNKTTLDGGKYIKNWPIYYAPFAKADKLIGIAPIKDHARSGASMTIKNWYGLLGANRNIFHQDINTIIVELSMLVKPTLVILDGTEVMMTNGPTGGSLSDLKRADTMIASCDHVAADSFGSTLLGLKPSDLPYLSRANNAGSGTTDYESLKPLHAEVS